MVLLRLILVVVGLWFVSMGRFPLTFLGLVLFLGGMFFPALGLVIPVLAKAEERGALPEPGEEATPLEREEAPGQVVYPQFATAFLWRRIAFWFTAGAFSSMSFFAYLAIRVGFLEKGRPAELVAANEVLLLTLAVAAVLISLPLGFLLHQIYFAVYWLGIWVSPVRFTRPDRAWETLTALSHELDYKQLYGRGIEKREDVRVSRAPPPVRLLLGPGTHFVSGNRRGLLDQAQRNWQLFTAVWHDLIPPERFEVADWISGFREDLFVLVGAMRVALVVAFFSYLVFDWWAVSLFASSHIPLRDLLWITPVNFAASYLVFWLLNIVRHQMDGASVDFKGQALHRALQRTQ